MDGCKGEGKSRQLSETPRIESLRARFGIFSCDQRKILSRGLSVVWAIKEAMRLSNQENCSTKDLPLLVRRKRTSSIPSRSFKRWQCHVPGQDFYCGFRSKIILIQLCVLFSGWLSWNSIRDVPQEVCLSLPYPYQEKCRLEFPQNFIGE